MFSERINLLLNALGINQFEFSKLIGLSSGVISEFASGARKPSKGFLFGLSKLGVSLDWFLTGEGSMFRSSQPRQKEDDFPEDPMQGLAYLDSLVEVLIDKGLIDKKDIPAPLPGVRRASPKMTEETRRKLQRDLEKARREFERIEAELERYRPYPPGAADEAFEPEEEYQIRIPLYEFVAAGRPQESFDLGETFLVSPSRLRGDPKEYFAVRIKGTSMTEAGIPDDAIVVIKKEIDLISGRIYLFRNEGEYTLKRYRLGDDLKPRLLHEDGTGREVEMHEGDDWEVVGVFCFVG